MKDIIIRNSNRFKSVFVAVNLLLPLKGNETGKNALLALVLSKSNKLFNTEKELHRELARLYDTKFDVNVEKINDTYNIQFGLEILNEEYVGKQGIKIAEDILYSTICEPNIKNNLLDNNIFEREKKTLMQRIEEERDDKKKYALKQLEKEMFKGTEYGASSLGELDDVRNITNEELVKHYKYVIENAEIVVIGSGNFKNMEQMPYDLYNRLSEKCGKNRIDIKHNVEKEDNSELKIKIENQDINQSVLCIGARIKDLNKEDIYKAMVYSAILGGTPASKLFQNVREKESLAYFAKAILNRQKHAIYMFCGIEPTNYEKAKRVMLEQLEQLKNGVITDVEFNAAKDNLISAYKEIKDSKEEQAKMLLKNEMYFSKQVEFKDMIKGIENVTFQDVIQIANTVEATNIFLLGGKTNE